MKVWVVEQHDPDYGYAFESVHRTRDGAVAHLKEGPVHDVSVQVYHDGSANVVRWVEKFRANRWKEVFSVIEVELQE